MFFILGYPKSRTTWLSCFLHDSTHPCFHEKSSEFSSFQEMQEWCEDNPTSGIIDTLLITKYEQLLPISDKIVIIDKHLCEVEESVIADGFPKESLIPLTSAMRRAKVDNRVKVVDYFNLFTKEGVRWLCSHLGIPFDEQKYDMLSECVITTDTPKFLQRVATSGNDYSWLRD